MSDLECRELVELVTAFLEHALDPETERRVVGHLARCDGCEQYLAQMRQTVRDLNELAPAAERLDPRARAALLRALRADGSDPTV